MKKILFVLSIFLILLCACTQSVEPENPEWIEKLIEEFESQPVGNPPQSIFRYEYKGQIVYYLPPQCCDQYSSLYNRNGNIKGAPDGGLSGAGDGKITDFFTERKNEKLIWKDSRE